MNAWGVLDMRKPADSLNHARRRLLKVFGFGAAATVAAATGSDKLFARQFFEKGTDMKVPDMVYDPKLQMMVDPNTRQPVYETNKDIKMAKVTAGCSDCPKYDSK